jgi:hypothetical protein
MLQLGRPPDAYEIDREAIAVTRFGIGLLAK